MDKINLIEDELWDHYSGLPNPKWYSMQSKNIKMNNLDKQYTDLIGDAYKNYVSQQTNMFMPIWSQEEFINKIKTDDEFAKKWGVKVEVRELSERERIEMIQPYGLDPLTKEGRDRLWKENNLPTRAISFTYNNETIESYE